MSSTPGRKRQPEDSGRIIGCLSKVFPPVLWYYASPQRRARIAEYLREMFPLPTYIPYGFAFFAAVYFTLQIFGGGQTLVVTWRAWFGATTVVLMMLLLRIYDELKDLDTDRRLGDGGDPRYKDRPIVTGRIREEDIVALRWLVTGLLFAFNLPLGAPWPLFGFLVPFTVMWMSFRWFFWPAVAENLLLAFVTHNPMVLLLVGYVTGIYVHEFGTYALSWPTLVLAASLWLPLAAWETSRKVRSPEEETEYQTYSQLLGWRVAGAVPALFAVAAATGLIVVAHRALLSWVFVVAICVTVAVVVGACLRFVVRPSSATSNLRPYAEVFLLVATAGLAVAGAVEYGVFLTVATSVP